tara:strand:- start:3474 stop:4070 length:597 start_codon:yes stop_codon:yes gene_type:complete
MKASEIVESIKDVLGMELSEVKVKLEIKELENGTKLEAESFEKGQSVFIVSEGEEQDRIAVPIGEYNFSDGTSMSVKEEGKIAKLYKKEDEDMEEEDDDRKEEADVADWKGMEKRIQNLEDAIADLKADKEKKNSEEVEATQEVEEKVEASKTELKEIEVAPEPISHNPEGEVKKQNVQFAKNRTKNTLDRVLEKMNQ